jgi:hypothetical protein
MQILKDEWTPMLQALRQKLSGPQRRKLLFQVIGEIQDITQLNFGSEGANRPSQWPELADWYAEEYHDGDRTPKLILSEFWHNKKAPGQPHLKDAFVHTFDENKATLTNTNTYADEHLPFTYAVNRNRNIPFRPYYPVTFDGTDLTPYAWGKIREILELHFRIGAEPF